MSVVFLGNKIFLKITVFLLLTLIKHIKKWAPIKLTRSHLGSNKSQLFFSARHYSPTKLIIMHAFDAAGIKKHQYGEAYGFQMSAPSILHTRGSCMRLKRVYICECIYMYIVCTYCFLFFFYPDQCVYL